MVRTISLVLCSVDVRGAQDYNGSDGRRGAQRVMRAEDSLRASSDYCSCGEVHKVLTLHILRFNCVVCYFLYQS